MYDHAPLGYKCPLCIAISGQENNDTLVAQSDIVYKDGLVMAFISSFFIGNNPGHVVIVPNKHFENIYSLPLEYANRIQEIAKKVAVALKEAYKCGGVGLLQNNEPIGDQHAFHYHLHVFPRYENDELFKNMKDKQSTTSEQRLPYADKIRAALSL
ncbi:MAG TPA: HIT family protein [Patescibacteria group bacterium]|nr:HIT family protein [Patescibacteria group bacterium]